MFLLRSTCLRTGEHDQETALRTVIRSIVRRVAAFHAGERLAEDDHARVLCSNLSLILTSIDGSFRGAADTPYKKLPGEHESFVVAIEQGS